MIDNIEKEDEKIISFSNKHKSPNVLESKEAAGKDKDCTEINIVNNTHLTKNEPNRNVISNNFSIELKKETETKLNNNYNIQNIDSNLIPQNEVEVLDTDNKCKYYY